MKEIQMGIACGYNSELYVNFLLETVRRTVNNINKFQIILGQSKPEVDVNHLAENNADFDIKIIQAFSKDSGSLGHGKCIDALLENMDSEYGMIVDCDIAFLEKNWDVKLIECLQHKKVVIGAGTSRNHHHYYNFPFTIMALFKTKPLKETKVSFIPRLEHIILTEENAKIFGRSPGDRIYLDTAWEMPFKLKTNGYDGIALKLVTPRDESKDAIKFMTSDMRGEEQQLDGIPFFTHVGRSQSRSFDDPIVVKWRNRVLEWLGRE